jgi:large subunit ribosomal protein L31
MKSEIHPEYYPEARVVCACGNTFSVGATVPEISTEVCSACHPFFTGEQRIVDTAGQVERFMRRLEAGETQRRADKERRDEKRRSELAAKRKRRGLTPMVAPSDDDSDEEGEAS